MSTDGSKPTISVVIPTTGRPELVRAINSARHQVGNFNVEIVVVNDSMNHTATDGIDADVVLWTGGGMRGGMARNSGVRASSGDYVAFLDDDDEWLPGKLQSQLAVFAAAPSDVSPVVSGRHVHVGRTDRKESPAGPATLIQPSEDVAQYLFRRRRPSVGRASMYTSTLMCSRLLALEKPWREDLARHQDWDWLIRLGNDGEVRFSHVSEVVVKIQTGSSQSISASSDWTTSMAWANEAIADRAIFVDFIVGQTLRYALNARSLAGVRAVVRSVLDKQRIPSIGPLVIGLSGLVPRRKIETLMLRGR